MTSHRHDLSQGKILSGILAGVAVFCEITESKAILFAKPNGSFLKITYLHILNFYLNPCYMRGKSQKDVYHRNDTFESRRSAFRWIKRLLGIPVVTHPTETIRNKDSDAWKREGLRRNENKGLYIFKWLGNLFSVREDDGDFYVDQGPHFNYGKHGKSLKGHGYYPKKKKK